MVATGHQIGALVQLMPNWKLAAYNPPVSHGGLVSLRVILQGKTFSRHFILAIYDATAGAVKQVLRWRTVIDFTEDGVVPKTCVAPGGGCSKVKSR